MSVYNGNIKGRGGEPGVIGLGSKVGKTRIQILAVLLSLEFRGRTSSRCIMERTWSLDPTMQEAILTSSLYL